MPENSESTKSTRQREAVLVPNQSLNEVFISRELVEYVLREMNIYNLMEVLERPGVG